eukprot:7379025-Prymnesium_polylepis.1
MSPELVSARMYATTVMEEARTSREIVEGGTCDRSCRGHSRSPARTSGGLGSTLWLSQRGAMPAD